VAVYRATATKKGGEDRVCESGGNAVTFTGIRYVVNRYPFWREMTARMSMMP
jgi:hypothetical protein